MFASHPEHWFGQLPAKACRQEDFEKWGLFCKAAPQKTHKGLIRYCLRRVVPGSLQIQTIPFGPRPLPRHCNETWKIGDNIVVASLATAILRDRDRLACGL